MIKQHSAYASKKPSALYVAILISGSMLSMPASALNDDPLSLPSSQNSGCVKTQGHVARLSAPGQCQTSQKVATANALLDDANKNETIDQARARAAIRALFMAVSRECATSPCNPR